MTIGDLYAVAVDGAQSGGYSSALSWAQYLRLRFDQPGIKVISCFDLIRASSRIAGRLDCDFLAVSGRFGCERGT